MYTSGNLVSIYPLDVACGIQMYKLNGAIYIYDIESLMYDNPTYELAYIMPRDRSIDIDTEEDFKRAEDIFSKLQQGQ